MPTATDPQTDDTDIEAVLAERVARGVEWLDSEVPDWVDKVEVKSLDLTSVCHCVLGQVFATEDTYDKTGNPLSETGFDLGLDRAADRAEAAESDEYDLHQWAIRHGFDSPGGRMDVFQGLQRLWEDVIAERRAAR